MISDKQLLSQTRSDPEAFGCFYDRHERQLLGYLCRQTGDPELAADLAAETFAALLWECQRGEAISEPRGWLYAVARRKHVDALRRGVVDDQMRRRLSMERVELTDEMVQEIEALAAEQEQLAMEALEELPSDQRHAVAARVLKERTYAAIAVDLECSEAVVRQRVSRGLSFLRRRLKERPS